METDLKYFFIFFVLFTIGQSLVMIGQFISLPYKNLTLWEGIKMSLPFVWADWIFMTFAVSYLHKYSLFTNTQFLFMIILFQFGAAILINKFYLKQKIYISDYVAILLLGVAYIISQFHLFSKYFTFHKEKKNLKNKNKK